MSGTIGEVRAMLSLFARSPWQELHVRSDGWELFLGRDGAAANPMRAAVVGSTATDTITAPHLGLFHALAAVGALVAAGTAIGEIEVLSVREPVFAPVAGRVIEVCADAGALVEYDAPLIRISA